MEIMFRNEATLSIHLSTFPLLTLARQATYPVQIVREEEGKAKKKGKGCNSQLHRIDFYISILHHFYF